MCALSGLTFFAFTVNRKISLSIVVSNAWSLGLGKPITFVETDRTSFQD